jgi:subtilisin family serine protease
MLQVVRVKKKFRIFYLLNKKLDIFYVASLSLLLLASTVAIPLQSFAEKPDNTKTPVVILFNDKVSQNNIDLIKSNGGEITRTYTIINGFAANLPPQAIENLQNNPSVIAVDPDIEFHALELQADERIGADQVWSHPTSPATGNGVRVAILDTGIDSNHQEFTDRIVLCENEIGEPGGTCVDGHGHGSHAAGIAGASGYDLTAKGAAPNIHFLISKVLADNGSGSLSGIIAGMDWAVANDAKVISMSLGTSAYPNASNCDAWLSSMRNAVNNAFAAGVLVVAAAGNSGAQGVGAPACLSNTIAVAAVDDNDAIASFSSVGLAVQDHGISAPGVSIYSSLPGDNYARWSGTSMATPVVAGVAALLSEAEPSLVASEIRTTLFNTACTMSTCPETPLIPDSSSTNYGHGRVNAIDALTYALENYSGPAPDGDGDGYSYDDCNDADDSVYPGALEIIDDGVDQDCNGSDKKEISVHDLDAVISGKKNMNGEVTVTVNDSNDDPVEGVTVPYTWSGDVSGSSSCITNSDGQCSTSQNTKLDIMIFTVGTLSLNEDDVSGTNHDHDGDSDGTTITINRGGGNNPGGEEPGGNDGGWDCIAKPNPKKC